MVQGNDNFFSNPSSRFVNKVDAPSTRPATPNLLKKRDVGFKKMRRYVVPAWAAHMVPTWVAHMVPTWAAHIVPTWAAHMVLTWAAHMVPTWAAHVVTMHKCLPNICGAHMGSPYRHHMGEMGKPIWLPRGNHMCVLSGDLTILSHPDLSGALRQVK